MIPQQETLQNWHWNLPDPVSRRVDIIATDEPQDDASRDRAA
jgi:electron transport complex protein RnfB